jgi:Spy/CpxP family protein refolding chaperone
MAHAFYLDRADELGLSADQSAKLKALQSDSRRDNIRNAAEVKIARLELADLLDGKDWSLKDAEPLIRKVQKLEGDIQVRYLHAMSGAQKVLTAEQLKQASSDAYGNAGKMESLFK